MTRSLIRRFFGQERLTFVTFGCALRNNLDARIWCPTKSSGDDGNNTPFFFIPVFLVGACTYLVLPIGLFIVQVIACAASFYAHVYFDKEYHIEGSRLQRFAWFRRKQELHFVHHRHADSNFAVIDFFWDRVLGTYRGPDPNGENSTSEPVGCEFR